MSYLFNRSAIRVGVATLVAAALAACETYDDGAYAQDPSISIPYDPYNFDPDEMLEEAQAHCDAYGLRAVYVDETIDPQSVRWRYRHFSCE